MPAMIETVLVLALLWLLAARQAPGWAWCTAIGAYLIAWPGLHGINAWLMLPAGVLYVAAVLLLAVAPVRRRLLSAPLMQAFRGMMPGMSDTEREALEAGSTWWETDLFSGKPDWHKLLAYPAPRLSEEEQAFLDGPVNRLCDMLDDWQITEQLHDLPPEVWQFLKEQRFFGMIIPRAYGGLEFSAHGHSSVVMKVASRSITAAVTTMVPTPWARRSCCCTTAPNSRSSITCRGWRAARKSPALPSPVPRPAAMPQPCPIAA